jgi:membrane fusion protein, adhesin transport system
MSGMINDSSGGQGARGDGFAVDAAMAIRSRSIRGQRLLLWVILLCLIGFFAWAYGAVLDEVVRGTGKVIPSSKVQVVQNLEGGIIKQINVSDGQRVATGDVLLVIDDTRFDSSLQESRTRELSLRAKAARLVAEADGLDAMPELAEDIRQLLTGVQEQQRKLFDERRQQLLVNRRILAAQDTQKQQSVAELSARRDRLARSLALATRELRVTEPLRDQGAVSEVEVLRLRRQVSDLQGELAEIDQAVPRVASELAEVRQRMIELDTGFRTDARAELNDVTAELQAMQAGNVALEDRVRRTQVRSPIDGVVKSLSVRTVGGVVQPGMDLVEIVPVDDNLLVEARVKPRDIAFLRPGLPAKVKLTAYDFAIYGGFDAQLEHISADTFVDDNGEAFFLVRVRTIERDLDRGGRLLSIIPGMTAEVDILIGEKTVLTYLIKPVLRARESALREP